MGRKEIALLSYNSGALGEMGTDGFTTDPGLLKHYFFSLSLVLSFKDKTPLFWTTIQIFFFFLMLLSRMCIDVW